MTDLIPPKLAAKRLCVAASTLAAWRCRGCGPKFVRCGRAIRYEAAEIEAFVERNRRRHTTCIGDNG